VLRWRLERNGTVLCDPSGEKFRLDESELAELRACSFLGPYYIPFVVSEVRRHEETTRTWEAVTEKGVDDGASKSDHSFVYLTPTSFLQGILTPRHISYDYPNTAFPKKLQYQWHISYRSKAASGYQQ
jgi:hypothetical protein